MLTDQLVRSLRAAALTGPGGRTVATIHEADVKAGDQLSFLLRAGYDSYRWTLPRSVVSDEVARAGDEISVWSVREALGRLYEARAGELVQLNTPGTGIPAQGQGPGSLPSGGDSVWDSGGDIEGVDSHSPGPGDPDLDF